MPVILGKFSKALKTSTEAEIRKRAATLATITALDILTQPLNHFEGTSAVDNVALLPVIAENTSRDGETSRERVRARKRHMVSLQTPFRRRIKKDSWPYQQFGEAPSEEDFIARLDIPLPKTHYLLISLLLEPCASLVCAFRKLTSNPDLDEKFLYNMTLCLHGQKDKLTSSEKVGRWIQEIQEYSKERSKLMSVPCAGHFWAEPGSMDILEFEVGKWLEAVLKDKIEWIWVPN
ncbi:MAG: hypothetical protein LQ352_004321 [Teloschistes flavicans]|nr:MAG: hypothetical protein LQ352_004321 [Teloschistes flavicans]